MRVIEDSKHSTAGNAPAAVSGHIPSCSPNKKKRKYKQEEPTSLPSFKFEKADGEAKYKIMKENMLTGAVVDFRNHTKVLSSLKTAKFDSLTCIELPVYNQLVGEFYCNLVEHIKMDGTAYFHTTVRGRPLLIDDILLKDVMGISMVKGSVIFDADKIVFNKSDFHSYLKVLCACDKLPSSLFEKEVGVSSDYFCRDAQFLALIYRANIMPKIPVGLSEKWFGFSDLKMMHDILTLKANINVPYFVVCQMIKASKVGYFAYGMFLTEIFKHFKLNLAAQPCYPVSSHISFKSLKLTVALKDFMPYGHCAKKPVLANIEGNLSMKEIVKNLNELKVAQNLSYNDLSKQCVELSGKVIAQTTVLDQLSKTVELLNEKVAILENEMGQQQVKALDRLEACQGSNQKEKGKEPSDQLMMEISGEENIPSFEQLLSDSQQYVGESSQLTELQLDSMGFINHF